jgi:hypothetical protein
VFHLQVTGAVTAPARARRNVLRLRIIVAAIAAAALALPGSAGAAKKGEEVKVMLRNLYLGAPI